MAATNLALVLTLYSKIHFLIPKFWVMENLFLSINILADCINYELDGEEENRIKRKMPLSSLLLIQFIQSDSFEDARYWHRKR